MAMRFLRAETERQIELEGLALQTPTTTANLISLLLPSANHCQKIEPREVARTTLKVIHKLSRGKPRSPTL
jgi:hypothetical protein